jgi:hypothetical protein
MENTYFDQKSYENDITLEVNQDVLTRMYEDGISPADLLPLEFFFVTDSELKAANFMSALGKSFPQYESLEISEYDEDFEISGTTDPKQMDLQTINEWNKTMWDFGYQYDCKLDGWQVGV